MYCIAKFTDENNDVAVVPKTWIIGKRQCYWPTGVSSVKKLIKRGKAPEDNEKEKWMIHNVAVMKSYDTYQEAHNNLGLATMTSDLDTTPCRTRNTSRRPPSSPPPATLQLNCFPNNLVHPTKDVVPEINVCEVNEIVNDSTDVANNVVSTDQSTQTSNETSISEDFQLVVISKLAAIQDKQKEHGEMLQTLWNVFAGASVQTVTPTPPSFDESKGEIQLDLPLCTVEALKSFDESMQKDDSVKAFIKYLIGTGGSDVPEAVQRTLEKVLHDELAAKFSLLGKRGKLSFIDYSSTIAAIKEGIRSYPSLSQLVASGQLDDKSFKAALQASFKRVSDRVFQRNNKTRYY